MKRILTCFLGIIILASCSMPPRFRKTEITSENVTLIPYIDNKYRYGYVDAETFEIVIPAQYEYTGPFVKGYAMAAKKQKEYDDRNNKFLINKNNEIVLKYFNYAYIIESEDQKTVYALTLSNSGHELNKWDGFIFPQYDIRPRNIIFRIYNLNTGKLLLERKDYYGAHGTQDQTFQGV